MGRRSVLGLFAVGLVFVSGCAGGGDENSDAPPDTVVPYEQNGPSLEEWQAATTAVCKEYEPQQEAVLASHGVPQSPAEITALLAELKPVADAYREALEAIDVPAARRRDIERTHELYQLTDEAVTAIWTASVGGDPDAIQSASGSLEARSAELTTLLRDLGVPACL